MKSMPPSQNLSDDLNWQAYLYAADELSPQLAESFEQRLAEDQPTRDALVQAVQLEMLLKQTSPSVDRSADHRPEPRQLVDWLSVIATVAACLLLAITLSIAGRSGGDQTAQKEIEQAEQLVAAWSDFEAPEIADLEEVPADLLAVNDTADSMLPPDWMLLAIKYREAMPMMPEEN